MKDRNDGLALDLIIESAFGDGEPEQRIRRATALYLLGLSRRRDILTHVGQYISKTDAVCWKAVKAKGIRLKPLLAHQDSRGVFLISDKDESVRLNIAVLALLGGDSASTAATPARSRRKDSSGHPCSAADACSANSGTLAELILTPEAPPASPSAPALLQQHAPSSVAANSGHQAARCGADGGGAAATTPEAAAEKEKNGGGAAAAPPAVAEQVDCEGAAAAEPLAASEEADADGAAAAVPLGVTTPYELVMDLRLDLGVSCAQLGLLPAFPDDGFRSPHSATFLTVFPDLFWTSRPLLANLCAKVAAAWPGPGPLPTLRRTAALALCVLRAAADEPAEMPWEEALEFLRDQQPDAIAELCAGPAFAELCNRPATGGMVRGGLDTLAGRTNGAASLYSSSAAASASTPIDAFALRWLLPDECDNGHTNGGCGDAGGGASEGRQRPVLLRIVGNPEGGPLRLKLEWQVLMGSVAQQDSTAGGNPASAVAGGGAAPGTAAGSSAGAGAGAGGNGAAGGLAGGSATGPAARSNADGGAAGTGADGAGEGGGGRGDGGGADGGGGDGGGDGDESYIAVVLAAAIAAAWPGDDPLARVKRAAATLLAAEPPSPPPLAHGSAPSPLLPRYTLTVGRLGSELSRREREAFMSLPGPGRLGLLDEGADGSGGGGGRAAEGVGCGGGGGGRCVLSKRGYLWFHKSGRQGEVYVTLRANALIKDWRRRQRGLHRSSDDGAEEAAEGPATATAAANSGAVAQPDPGYGASVTSDDLAADGGCAAAAAAAPPASWEELAPISLRPNGAAWGRLGGGKRAASPATAATAASSSATQSPRSPAGASPPPDGVAGVAAAAATQAPNTASTAARQGRRHPSPFEVKLQEVFPKDPPHCLDADGGGALDRALCHLGRRVVRLLAAAPPPHAAPVGVVEAALAAAPRQRVRDEGQGQGARRAAATAATAGLGSWRQGLQTVCAHSSGVFRRFSAPVAKATAGCGGGGRVEVIQLVCPDFLRLADPRSVTAPTAMLAAMLAAAEGLAAPAGGAPELAVAAAADGVGGGDGSCSSVWQVTDGGPGWVFLPGDGDGDGGGGGDLSSSGSRRARGGRGGSRSADGGAVGKRAECGSVASDDATATTTTTHGSVSSAKAAARWQLEQALSRRFSPSLSSSALGRGTATASAAEVQRVAARVLALLPPCHEAALQPLGSEVVRLGKWKRLQTGLRDALLLASDVFDVEPSPSSASSSSASTGEKQRQCGKTVVRLSCPVLRELGAAAVAAAVDEARLPQQKQQRQQQRRQADQQQQDQQQLCRRWREDPWEDAAPRELQQQQHHHHHHHHQHQDQRTERQQLPEQQQQAERQQLREQQHQQRQGQRQEQPQPQQVKSAPAGSPRAPPRYAAESSAPTLEPGVGGSASDRRWRPLLSPSDDTPQAQLARPTTTAVSPPDGSRPPPPPAAAVLPAAPAAPPPAAPPMPDGPLPDAPVQLVYDPYSPEYVRMLQHYRTCKHVGIAVYSYGDRVAVLALYAPGSDSRSAGGGSRPGDGGRGGGGIRGDDGEQWPATVYLIDCAACADHYGGGAAGELVVSGMLQTSLRRELENAAVTKVVYGCEQVRVLELACGGAAIAPLLDLSAPCVALAAMLQPVSPPPPPSPAAAAAAAASEQLWAHLRAFDQALTEVALWPDKPKLKAKLLGQYHLGLERRAGGGGSAASLAASRLPAAAAAAAEGGPLSEAAVETAAGAARHLPELWAAVTGEAVPWVAVRAAARSMRALRGAGPVPAAVAPAVMAGGGVDGGMGLGGGEGGAAARGGNWRVVPLLSMG